MTHDYNYVILRFHMNMIMLIEISPVGAMQVLMKDIVTPVAPEEIRAFLQKCMENAALINYTKVSELAKIEGG